MCDKLILTGAASLIGRHSNLPFEKQVLQPPVEKVLLLGTHSVNLVYCRADLKNVGVSPYLLRNKYAIFFSIYLYCIVCPVL